MKKLLCVLAFPFLCAAAFAAGALPAPAQYRPDQPAVRSDIDEEAAEKAYQKRKARRERRLFKQVRGEVKNGHADSVPELAWLYYRGTGVKRNYKKAYKWFSKAAAAHPQAALAQALMLQQGKGVRKNEQKAFQALQALAQNGDPHAAFQLSEAYERGIGCPPDPEQASRWLDYAVRYAVPPALLKKGALLLENNPQQGFQLIRRAADLQFRPAQYELARLYERGTAGPADPSQAFNYMLRAAKQKLAAAQWQIALWYEQGYGRKQSDFQTFRWTRLAAFNGLPEARRKLAQLYENGTGVRADPKRAQKWIRLAGQRDDRPEEEEFY